MGKRTTSEFIERATLVHNSVYTYEYAEYINSKEFIIITCKHHGNFKQVANSHLNGHGCTKCAIRRKNSPEEFISKSEMVHDCFYDYSDVDYTNHRVKVSITCPIHGSFRQSPNAHIQGQGCPLCAIEKSKSNTYDFIKKSINVHGGIYSYSKVEYLGSDKKVVITCPVHGDFKQNPYGHLKGEGCAKCGRETHWSRSNFIKKAKNRNCTFYTLRCFNEDETFYKIGITMRDVKKRYACIKEMPYTYEIVSEVFGEAEAIWNLEVENKRKLKEFNYQPKIYFGGSKTECFTKYKIEDDETI